MIAYFLANGHLGADELPRRPADHALRLRLLPRPGQRLNGDRRGGGAGARLPGDPLDLRQRLRRPVAGAGGRGGRRLGDVEGAGAAPLRRDRGRARPLAGLRRRRPLLRPAAGGDDRRRLAVDEPDVGGVPLGRRSRRSPGGGAGARDGGGPAALRPARRQALGRCSSSAALEHCVLAGTGSEDSDPESVPVRPLSSRPRPRRRSRPPPRGRRGGLRRKARSASTTPASTRRTSCASPRAPTNATASTTRSTTATPPSCPTPTPKGAATGSASPTSRPPTRWRRAASTSACWSRSSSSSASSAPSACSARSRSG